ncbi:SusC/RagA family TonB-linked outer membrane protein [Algoriphagus sp. A40]|uniref:SusC/RagA family TonB-linked outer membrane protein n=1 Tax=Algoriphagus sp. A40 TaxID=1945863 RepID=UPI000984CBF2|nr:SusC/RagA family TonB-linked outer membrane protein [Algoriphagus sp. A40]
MNHISKKLLSPSVGKAFMLLLFCCWLTGLSAVMAQSPIKISGKVISETDTYALPGVNVLLKGTQTGTVTDINGDYTIEVPNRDAVLVFSFIGFDAVEIPVGNQTTVNTSMKETSTGLEEVVVTALGIQREERSLGYSVGKVQGEDLTRVAQENVLNSLAGKVAGATINSTGGTGSSVSMVIRGATSLNTDNQPLFVVDGVPMSNSLNNLGRFGADNIVDYGNAISDLNPEDIENVTVLKGPSAAALYGTRAGNGVVLITTKKAKKNQRMQVNLVSNTVLDVPYQFLNVQKDFASGYFSFRPEDVGGGVLPPVNAGDGAGAGPELDKGYFAQQWNAPLDANGFPIPTELVSNPDNVNNFVNTGITTTNGISASNSTETLDYRLNLTNMTHQGIIPGSDLYKNNFSTAASTSPVKNLTISTSVNFNKSWSNNRPSSNRGTNPLQWAYSNPQEIDIQRLEDYWIPGQEGLQVLRASPNHENPYFLAHEVKNSFERNRIYGNIMAEWEISESFKIRGRYLLDQYDERRETKIPLGYTKEPNNGAYGLANISSTERNIDFLATYSKVWDKLNFSISAGGNSLYAKNTYISNSSKAGAGLVVPNVFSVSNIANASLDYASSWSQRGIYSIYSMANIGWKDWLYLDITARNDWSSTLPIQNHSYFYPSASLSMMINDAFSLTEKISQLKVRGGYAQVGNDTSPYNLYPTYNNYGQWGSAIRMGKSGTILAPDLNPEKATSYEVGLDLGLFDDRVRLEGTYYFMENRNQILPNIPLPVSSGFNNININAGLLESKGIEVVLGLTPIRKENWTWDINMNFSRNRTYIRELAEGVDVIEFWSDNKSYSYGYVANEETGEDGLVGNIYSFQKQRVTDKNSPYFGYPIIGQGLDAEWLPTAKPVKVGNYNPDFLMGMQSSLSFKNWSLNMTFDWRSGGQYMSQTFRYFSESASTQSWLDNLVNPNGLGPGEELRQWVIDNADWLLLSEELRPIGGPTPGYGGFPEGFSGTTVYDGTFAPGVVGYHDEEGNFVLIKENLGGPGTTFLPYVVSFPWEFGTPAMFDADFIKLREISLGYRLPRNVAQKIGIQGANLSVYSRNIMLWTKDSGFGIDPERAFQAEASKGNRGTQFKQGIERYNVDPWVIPVGFKLDVTF